MPLPWEPTAIKREEQFLFFSDKAPFLRSYCKNWQSISLRFCVFFGVCDLKLLLGFNLKPLATSWEESWCGRVRGWVRVVRGLLGFGSSICGLSTSLQ